MPERFHAPGFRGGIRVEKPTPTPKPAATPESPKSSPPPPPPPPKPPESTEVKERRHSKILQQVLEGEKAVITHTPPAMKTFDYKVEYENNIVAQFKNEIEAYKFVKMMNKAKGSEVYSLKR